MTVTANASTAEPRDWALPNVRLAHGSRVRVTHGAHAGTTGSIVSLWTLAADPAYLVEADGSAHHFVVAQSCLQRHAG